MTSLRREVQDCLTQFLAEHENEESSVELLRMLQREAWLLQETEQMKDVFRLDPFECLKEWTQASMDRLFRFEVTDCHRVHTKSGYCNISATCQISSDVRMKSQGVSSGVELFFRYERQAMHFNDKMSPTVLYGISISKDHGPSEKLLWVEVYTEGHTPSLRLPAVNMMEDDNEDWEDMDDEEDGSSKTKKLKARGKNGEKMQSDSADSNVDRKTDALGDDEIENDDNGDPDKDQEMQEEPDKYIAGIDSDVLAQFLRWSNLGGEMADDLNAFHFLMTFPFYESEFDLIGYLLEGVFGAGDDDDESESS